MSRERFGGRWLGCGGRVIGAGLCGMRMAVGWSPIEVVGGGRLGCPGVWAGGVGRRLGQSELVWVEEGCRQCDQGRRQGGRMQ